MGPREYSIDIPEGSTIVAPYLLHTFPWLVLGPPILVLKQRVPLAFSLPPMAIVSPTGARANLEAARSPQPSTVEFVHRSFWRVSMGIFNTFHSASRTHTNATRWVGRRSLDQRVDEGPDSWGAVGRYKC
jgi:hypothetical protein